jgi:UDP-N-acetylglucosamine--N-acetylmuramyl-(pentapeptide) pyrophosphoryl-undecaprenol N-acetylglucosamine transferase
MKTSSLVWVMAGGTGGHIMPGLAVADWLQKHGCDIRWVGNPDKMEGRLVRPAGYEMIRSNLRVFVARGYWRGCAPRLVCLDPC